MLMFTTFSSLVGEEMVELDELLSVIENPARRRILEALAREPHYPLQLSKELGMSQQAVMKHLKVLEQYDLVRSYQEKSDLGGPNRKQFYPALNFTIVVDAGPNMFSAELFSREEPAAEEREEHEEEGTLEERVRELRGRVGGIDARLEELYRQREELIMEKESILEEVAHLTDRLGDYQLRRILYEFISRPQLDLQGIARAMAVRDEAVIDTLNKWLREER